MIINEEILFVILLYFEILLNVLCIFRILILEEKLRNNGFFDA